MRDDEPDDEDDVEITEALRERSTREFGTFGEDSTTSSIVKYVDEGCV
jgi:hypothetical protein